jgi:signal transduction histidine kinase/ligand-binding sensor domain-containing protein
MFRALITPFSCCAFPLLFSQQVEVARYDLEQGLPQSMVNHVLQDSDGFIWLGTGDGLARFDGHRFVVYKHDERDSTSLSHNSIWGLAEKDARHLFVGTRNGLDVLDRRTGKFAHAATGLSADQNGCWQPLWQRSDGALFYSPLSSQLLNVTSSDVEARVVAHPASYAMHADPRTGIITQALWPSTLLTIGANKQERLDMLPTAPGERIDEILPLGNRWLILSSMSAWTWSIAEGRKPLPQATQAWMDRASKRKRGAVAVDGRIWVGQSGVGVAILDEELRIQQAYPLLPESERPLDITVIAFDRQGNAWVGTDGKGVFAIAPQRIKFGRVMPDQGLPWEPSSWFVRGFGQWDEDHVLVNFYQGGFALFDEQTRTLRPLELPSATQARMVDPDRMGPLTDAHGALWIRDARNIIALEARTGQLLLQRQSIHGTALAIGADGDAVVLSRDGLHAMRHGPRGIAEEGLRSDHLRSWMDSIQTMPNRMAFDRHDHLLVCHPVVPIAAWRNDQRIPIGPFPTSTRFTAIHAAKGDDLWMTSNDGLYLLNGSDLTIRKHWTVHEGLPDQFLYGMLPGGDGTWWIATNNGISHYDPAASSFRNFTTADGLQSKEFNTGALFRSTSGRLYLGGVNGFNHFLPDRIRYDTDTAHVALIGLAAQDSVIDLARLGDSPAITLPFGRNHLRIDLAVLEFSAPDRNRYRWRINGYSDWREQLADRPITVTNMPPGEYTLEVIGINADAVASVPRELLRITVPLPFWASPWAYVLGGALVVVVLGGAAFLAYRHQVRRGQERAEQELKELRIRARIAHDLHDDVGSGLARITALARTAERKGGKGEDAQGDVERVRALSQELMQNLRDVVWVNDPKDGDLAALLLRIRDFTEDLFEPTGAICSFDFPAPLPERQVGSQARRNLFLIAKEAAHNALKYSGASRITWRFAIDGATFTLELLDNGEGMAKTGRTSDGHGLRNMNERAMEMGAQLTIRPGMQKGVLVRVEGPLSALDL